MKNSNLEERKAKTIASIKALEELIEVLENPVLYGSKVEANEELSNWMPIILICSAIVSWVIVYAVCAATGMLK